MKKPSKGMIVITTRNKIGIITEVKKIPTHNEIINTGGYKLSIDLGDGEMIVGYLNTLIKKII